MASGKIIIYFDDENCEEDTIREVLRLMEQGYTSGYYPRWEIIKGEDEDNENT